MQVSISTSVGKWCTQTVNTATEFHYIYIIASITLTLSDQTDDLDLWPPTPELHMCCIWYGVCCSKSIKTQAHNNLGQTAERSRPTNVHVDVISLAKQRIDIEHCYDTTVYWSSSFLFAKGSLELPGQVINVQQGRC